MNRGGIRFIGKLLVSDMSRKICKNILQIVVWISQIMPGVMEPIYNEGRSERISVYDPEQLDCVSRVLQGMCVCVC